MGQLPKSKIEQLKREKREAKAAKKRKVATRERIVRFLIVCEGERTEPNYFRELVKDKYSEVRSERLSEKVVQPVLWSRKPKKSKTAL